MPDKEIVIAPEMAVYTPEDGVEAAGGWSPVALPTEYVRRDMIQHEYDEILRLRAENERLCAEIRSYERKNDRMAHALTFYAGVTSKKGKEIIKPLDDQGRLAKLTLQEFYDE